MSDNIEERLRILEGKVEDNRQLIDGVCKTITIMQEQNMILLLQSGAYLELFILLIKIGVIDERKHKKEYGQFHFKMNEARGYMKNAIRKRDLDLGDGI